MKKNFKFKLFGFIPLLSINEEHKIEKKIEKNNSYKSSIIDENIAYCTKVYQPYNIANTTIGKGTYIAANSCISMTTIGRYCSIGPNLVCGYGIHPINGISTSPCFYSSKKQNGMSFCNEDKIEERKPVIIGNDVFIGMNVSILDGVSIGDGAIIGAGAVVNKDIPPYAIAIGVPAKVIKYRFDEKSISQLLKIKWWDWDDEKLQNIEKLFFDINKFIKKYGK